MKKTYITPALRDCSLETVQMIAVSPNISVGTALTSEDVVTAEVREESNPFDFNWE